MTVAGIDEPDRDADSHVPPESDTDSGLPLVPATFTVCAAGAAPPAVALKFKVVGLRLNMDELPLTVNVTGIDSGLFDAPEEEIVKEPW